MYFWMVLRMLLVLHMIKKLEDFLRDESLLGDSDCDVSEEQPRIVVVTACLSLRETLGCIVWDEAAYDKVGIEWGKYTERLGGGLAASSAFGCRGGVWSGMLHW